MEAKDQTPSSRAQKASTKRAYVTQDSCFGAHLKEGLKDLENLKQGQHQWLESCEKFEDNVTKMNNDCNISSDIFLKQAAS
jgi:hypothetical protein